MNQIDKINGLYVKATPGPWNGYDDSDSTGRQEIVATGVTVARIYNGNDNAVTDGKTIVALYNAWPAVARVLEAAAPFAICQNMLVGPPLKECSDCFGCDLVKAFKAFDASAEG